jgi:hypothetical protein
MSSITKGQGKSFAQHLKVRRMIRRRRRTGPGAKVNNDLQLFQKFKWSTKATYVGVLKTIMGFTNWQMAARDLEASHLLSSGRTKIYLGKWNP